MPVIVCESCQKRSRVPDGASGTVRCPHCGTATPASAPAAMLLPESPEPPSQPQQPRHAPRSGILPAALRPVAWLLCLAGTVFASMIGGLALSKARTVMDEAATGAVTAAAVVVFYVVARCVDELSTKDD